MRECAPLVVLAVVLAGCTASPDAEPGPGPATPAHAQDRLHGLERPSPMPPGDAVHLDACTVGEVALLADRGDFEGHLPEGFALDADEATGLARIVATVLDCRLGKDEARAILPVVAVVPPDALRNASADLHGIQLGIVTDHPDLVATLRGWGLPEPRKAAFAVERYLLPPTAALHVQVGPDFLLTVDAAVDAAPPANRRVFGMDVAQNGSVLTGAFDLELADGPYLGGAATVSFVVSPQVGDAPDHRVGHGRVGLLDRDVRLRWAPL